MIDEKPLRTWKELICLAEEVYQEKCDYRKAKRLFECLGEFRTMGGHPWVYRSRVWLAIERKINK